MKQTNKQTGGVFYEENRKNMTLFFSRGGGGTAHGAEGRGEEYISYGKEGRTRASFFLDR